MRTLALLVPLALASLPLLACSSDKNHAERAQAAAMDPSTVNFDHKNVDALKAACIGACKVDPGSIPVDVVAAETGYQFAWLWDLNPGGENKAWATFTYDDNTSKFQLPVPTPSTTGYGQGGWEPTADPVPAGQGPAWAARFKGGPFTEYGGGFGMSLRTVSNTIDPMALTQRTNPGIALLEQTPSAEFPDPSAGAYDLTTWEGVAIWVRRGPDGQSTMRLGITERNSAEDLNSSAVVTAGATPRKPIGVEEGKYCQRWRYCGCSGTTPCSLVPGTTDDYRCFDPAFGPPVTADPDFQIDYPHCGISRCKDKNSSTAGPDRDPLFDKLPGDDPRVTQEEAMCTHAVTGDGHADMFCYDPALDPPPPAKRQRCNNPFSRPITVSTDWQLIKVPFSELRQADEAKVSDEMDLRSVKQMVVTYAGGWIDFWVANVGFYRAAPKP